VEIEGNLERSGRVHLQRMKVCVVCCRGWMFDGDIDGADRDVDGADWCRR
jgi:hypothetical protein